jgi:hypothetical protein
MDRVSDADPVQAAKCVGEALQAVEGTLVATLSVAPSSPPMDKLQAPTHCEASRNDLRFRNLARFALKALPNPAPRLFPTTSIR